jgi:hypothetical protein
MGFACPALVSADEIRILLAASRDAGVELQIRKLERAIRESEVPLAIAESLTDAHVVVQFTEYRRSIGKDGELLFRWAGEARLLKQPDDMTISGTPS